MHQRCLFAGGPVSSDLWATVGEDLKIMSDEALAEGLDHIGRGLRAESGDEVVTELASLVVAEAARRLRLWVHDQG